VTIVWMSLWKREDTTTMTMHKQQLQVKKYSVYTAGLGILLPICN